MGELYIIRHGQTTCNAEQVIQGPRIDSTLSELGQRQAGALGGAFEHTGLDDLYVSPLTRARQTAQALHIHHPELPGKVVPELYEMDYGHLCGQRLGDVRDTVSEVLDAWRMGFIDQAFPGGESALLAQHRIRTFAQGILQEAMHQQVAVVAHGRINRILVATLTATPLQHLDRFPQDNANITHLSVDGDGARLRRVNDTSHLEDVQRAFS